MKLSQELAEIVSEFTGFNRTPDFKAVRSMPCSRSASGTSSPTRKNSGERRHSTIIAVGVDELPTVSITPLNGATTPEPKYIKHNSSPCISNVVCSTSLKSKLEKFRRSNSSGSEIGLRLNEQEQESEDEEDFHCNTRKSSTVSSYRLI